MSRKRRRPATPSEGGGQPGRAGGQPGRGGGSSVSQPTARGRGKGSSPKSLRGSAEPARPSGRPRSAATGKASGPPPAKGSAPKRGASARGTGQASARPARAAGSSSAAARSGSAKPARVAIPVVVQPPLLPSLARGLVIAGTSAVLLVSGAVATFVLWLIYSSTGLFRLASPGVTAQLISLLPTHSLLDIQFVLLIGRLLPGAAAFGFGAFLLLLRAALTTLWTGVALDAAGWSPAAKDGPGSGAGDSGRGWREAVRMGTSAVRGSLRTVLGVEAVSITLVALSTIVLTAVLGTIGAILALVAIMYFLVYAPVIAVAEGLPLRHVLRLSIRAARARGPQHLLLVLPYIFVSLLLILRAGGPGTPATPSILVWAYALVLGFVHLGVLAAVATRWLALRERVLAADAAAPPRGGRTAPAERPRTSLRGR